MCAPKWKPVRCQSVHEIRTVLQMYLGTLFEFKGLQNALSILRAALPPSKRSDRKLTPLHKKPVSSDHRPRKSQTVWPSRMINEGHAWKISLLAFFHASSIHRQARHQKRCLQVILFHSLGSCDNEQWPDERLANAQAILGPECGTHVRRNAPA